MTKHVACHATGDRCLACKHYRGESAVCEFAPYTSIEEADIEHIARIIWVGWDDEWTDIMHEIHAAAGRLHAKGYRLTQWAPEHKVPTRSDVSRIVRTLLTDGEIPEYHTQDDRGLEEDEYIDLVMKVLSALTLSRPERV